MQARQTYQFLADLVLFFHFLSVVFIVFGLLLILIGAVKKWRWVRNPWFRTVHLIAIGFVVVQAWLGKLCPLTYLENSLRKKAGETSYPGDFIGYWLQELLYYDLPFWVFTVLYSVFGLLVFICWLKIKPTPFPISPDGSKRTRD